MEQSVAPHLKRHPKAASTNPDYTMHELRHLAGSLAVESCQSLAVVSEMLGHKQVTTTLNSYIGVVQPGQRRVEVARLPRLA